MARLRVELIYWWRHHRRARLARPTLFTELLQLRKLHDRDPRLAVMTDKLGAKTLVTERLGADWVVPTLWSGTRLPEACSWTPPFVVKSRHGCNQTIVVRDPAACWAEVRRRAEGWQGHYYGGWLDEWGYRDVPRGIVVEPFVGEGDALPVDYKVYVFGGRAAFVQVHLDRERNHRWIVHDPDWRRFGTGREDVPWPTRLADMLAAAETMAAGFDFARVDFYQPGDRPLFGEMSFYPGSGLDPFDPPELDAIMGELWLAAAPSWLPSRLDPIVDRLEAAPV